MKHLGGIGCLVYVEWLLMAFIHGGYPCMRGLFTMRVHLWMATQEQRDSYVFRVLVGFQCSLRQYGLCLDQLS